MISTCSYSNYESDAFKVFSISGDKGASVGFNGNYYKSLAPKKDFWTVWHNNIGVISEAENLKYYVTEYYKQCLSVLNPEEVYRELDNSILLCYEPSLVFCHRDIVAAWFKLFLGIEIPEVKVVGFRIIEQQRFDVTNILEEVIRENTDLKGFECIQAYYMFEKSNKLDDEAYELEKLGKESDSLRNQACFLRCDADMLEDEYKYRKRKKKVKYEQN